MYRHGLPAAITAEHWAANIRRLASKCCYEVTDAERWGLLCPDPRRCHQPGRRLALSSEIVGCSSVCVRNKNAPGFTTDYKESMKRLPELVVLS